MKLTLLLVLFICASATVACGQVLEDMYEVPVLTFPLEATSTWVLELDITLPYQRDVPDVPPGWIYVCSPVEYAVELRLTMVW